MIRVLGMVQAGIGNPDELFESLRIGRIRRDSVVDGDIHRDIQRVQDVGEDNANAFAEGKRLRRVGLRKQK